MFSADHLIRLVVEEGLNQLPYNESVVTTPTGYKYEGVKFEKGNCGVSIMRSGRFTRAALSLCMHRISCYFPVSLSVIIAAVACFSPNLPTCVVCLHVALELWSMCC